MQKLLLRQEEVSELLGICRAKAYRMMQTGELPGVVKIGRSVRVNARALKEWIEEQTEATAQARA